MKIGFHVSISGSLTNSIRIAEELNCSAFQIFSRNPRGWNAKPLDEGDIKQFKTKINESNIDKRFLVVHMPYLPNLAAPEGETYKKSRMTLYEEIERSYALGISNIVIHLGSHLGSGEDKGIDQIVKACNFAIDEFKDKNRKHIPINVLLENSAGQKNSIGSKFEQLGMLLDKLNNKQYGICLDTCHAFSAGYDLRNKDKVNNVVEAFDKFVGIKHLKVLHLNDSKFNLNENKDRHEHIGLGHIGKEGMREILNTKYFSDVPIIMETPVDEKRGNKENMDVVSELIRTN